MGFAHPNGRTTRYENRFLIKLSERLRRAAGGGPFRQALASLRNWILVMSALARVGLAINLKLRVKPPGKNMRRSTDGIIGRIRNELIIKCER
jgi:hypothetical protein